MKIILYIEAYELLRAHIPPDTPAYTALLAATIFKGRSSMFDQYWIECGDVEAEMYLAAAEQYFPERVEEIQSAIPTATRGG
jgi:hypothetical protein